MNHSPAKCQVCGEYHCLAGCVPVKQCYNKRKTQTRIDQITALLEEYRDCHEELSAPAIAREIDALYHEDVEISENTKAFWIESASGAER